MIVNEQLLIRLRHSGGGQPGQRSCAQLRLGKDRCEARGKSGWRGVHLEIRMRIRSQTRLPSIKVPIAARVAILPLVVAEQDIGSHKLVGVMLGQEEIVKQIVHAEQSIAGEHDG